MSGILGLYNLDGAPVDRVDLEAMAWPLRQRGPERTGLWDDGPVGLGHTLLATTPQAVYERLPLTHPPSGCTITADVRLDDRARLVASLDLDDRGGTAGDAEIVLAAYLAWGERCVEHLLGDFAFAVWDPRSATVFCARDHMGMRTLYYHHRKGKLFAFATEPRAILVLPQAPYRINDVRIADFLVSGLEGADKVTTFFEEVSRLPPAHTLTVTPSGCRQRRYWTLEPVPELRLTSDQAYVEAWQSVLDEAVRCRLRTAGPPATMASGGLDSGSIVVTARRLLAAEGRGPLLTFSAVSPEGDADSETRALRATLATGRLSPQLVSYGDIGAGALMPDLGAHLWELEEPFDGIMTLLRAVYMTASESGVTTLLDGVSGDIVLSEGRTIARLLRAGRWPTALREAIAKDRFWNGDDPPVGELLRSAKTAFVPESLRRIRRGARQDRRITSTIESSLISAELAHRADVAGRLRAVDRRRPVVALNDGGAERAQGIEQPYLTVARERYDRVAAACAVEPRDPFLDIRVAAFCTSLPDRQVFDHGWPKAILRRATAAQLPASVRWRRGRDHLGWIFTRALMIELRDVLRDRLDDNLEAISEYVDVNRARPIWSEYLTARDESLSERVYALIYLSEWVRRHAQRPKVSDTLGGTAR